MEEHTHSLREQADGDGKRNVESETPSSQKEEEALKKKYGGILPKKLPLISTDHERAYFDSADWALGKQGAPVEKSKGPLEALRPKLQPTEKARPRRSAYAPSDNEEKGETASEERRGNQ